MFHHHKVFLDWSHPSMSIMYMFCLHTSTEPIEILKEAYQAIEMDGIQSEFKMVERQLAKEWDGPDRNGMGMSASYRVVARLSYQEDFDIDLNRCLYFYIDKFENRVVQDIQAIKVVLHLLEKYEGDALFENTHVALLIRKAGVVTIDPEANPWNQECLDLIKIPHRIATLGVT